MRVFSKQLNSCTKSKKSSLRDCQKDYGSKRYLQATGILITAPARGSNGVRNRLWKRELQKLVNEIKIPITLCHFPPVTSKWGVIEHQLFSFISINWRAKPLTSLAVILELISHTTTKSGLTVTAMADTNTYQTKNQSYRCRNATINHSARRLSW